MTGLAGARARQTGGAAAAARPPAKSAQAQSLPPPAAGSELRLWLRMLTCTSLIEADLRRRLRQEFRTTLPRFDLLAALDRAPGGLTLGEVSARMMVSRGNITGLAARLEAEGLVGRRQEAHDKRVGRLTLTPSGRAVFATQCTAHAGWVAEIFAGLPAPEREALHRLLGRTKSALQGALEDA